MNWLPFPWAADPGRLVGVRQMGTEGAVPSLEPVPCMLVGFLL